MDECNGVYIGDGWYGNWLQLEPEEFNPDINDPYNKGLIAGIKKSVIKSLAFQNKKVSKISEEQSVIRKAFVDDGLEIKASIGWKANLEFEAQMRDRKQELLAYQAYVTELEKGNLELLSKIAVMESAIRHLHEELKKYIAEDTNELA